MPGASGALLWQGASRFDGAPIVAIATGLNARSRNAKTGDLAQVWILRSDVAPMAAVNSGADRSICGSCRHRGAIVDGRNVDRTCYVTVWQAPRSVWESWRRGIYPPAELDSVFDGRKVRIGAYGDPGAVPFDVWRRSLAPAAAVTGYTHAWRDNFDLSAYCMASCDTVSETIQARLAGWRTFRVRRRGEDLAPREIACPAALESGHKTTCSACVACGGHAAKARANVAILAHGAAGKISTFERLNHG